MNFLRPLFSLNPSAFPGLARRQTSLIFASQIAVDEDVAGKLGLERRAEAVKNCRDVRKADMIHNDATPKISVNPETYEVRADGELLSCEPARELPMTQRYFLF